MRSTVVDFLKGNWLALALSGVIVAMVAWHEWPRPTPDDPDVGTVSLPGEVRVKAGGYVKLTARMGKGVSDLTWVTPGGVFSDVEEYGNKLALSPANDGVYSVYATGLYRGKIVTAAECRVIVGQGPQPPPVPPDPPAPNDPFVKTLQEAYGSCGEADKADSLAKLTSLWKTAPGLFDLPDAPKTKGGVYGRLHGAAQIMMGDKLAPVRKAIEAEHRKTVTDDEAPITPDLRGVLTGQFNRTANALKQVRS